VLVAAAQSLVVLVDQVAAVVVTAHRVQVARLPLAVLVQESKASLVAPVPTLVVAAVVRQQLVQVFPQPPRKTVLMVALEHPVQ